MSPKAKVQKQKKKASSLLQNNRLPEAREAYLKVCKLDPTDYESWLNLGAIHGGMGVVREAENAFLKALAIKPDLNQALFNLAALYLQQGHFTEAEKYLQRFNDLNPRNTDICLQLAIIRHKLGRFEEALVPLKTGLLIEPDNVKLLNQQGIVFTNLRRYEEAETALLHAAKFPDFQSSSLCNLGNLYYRRRKIGQAIEQYKRSLEVKPNVPSTLVGLGICYAAQEKFEAALSCFEKALAINPKFAGAHWNRAHLLLQKGRYLEGWEDYEWRLDMPELVELDKRIFSKPRWDGKEVCDKTLLVYAEQGFGDTLQFCRYLALIRSRVGRLVFECQPELVELLGDIAGADEVLPRRGGAQELNVPYDFYIPLMSLPYLCKTTLETIPTTTPYVRISEKKQAAWTDRLDRGSIKVGLVWAGNPKHHLDVERSISLESLQPLMSLKDVFIYGLQKGGYAEHQVKTLEQKFNFINLGEEFHSFADTAAVIANLDMVISVDTSVAHLAGAMNKPVHILLSYPSEWRWLLDRSDTPWYPGAVLHRQGSDCNWQPIIDHLIDILKRT